MKQKKIVPRELRDKYIQMLDDLKLYGSDTKQTNAIRQFKADFYRFISRPMVSVCDAEWLEDRLYNILIKMKSQSNAKDTLDIINEELSYITNLRIKRRGWDET